LIIENSRIPTLKNDLFTESFGNLEFLGLANNAIREIEEDAFERLIKLEAITLSYNRIEHIKTSIFSNNPELKVISLNGNKIKALHRDLFKDLKNLQCLSVRHNLCVNAYFGCKTDSSEPVSQDKLNKGLLNCFNNTNKA
jgi:Leucine-rich repeat (LRR) protein